MIHPETHIVKPDDERPARPDGCCFYCDEPIGGIHKEDCVIRDRTVVVDATFRIVRKFPEKWDKELIEFRMNESTFCADNLISELDSVATDGHCLCGQFEGKFVREATDADEKTYGVTDAEYVDRTFLKTIEKLYADKPSWLIVDRGHLYQALSNPKWELTERVHDWRNYVPEVFKAQWDDLQNETQLALYVAGEQAADGENWD